MRKIRFILIISFFTFGNLALSQNASWHASFINDTTQTEWIEYTYEPNGNNKTRFLSEQTYKDLENRVIISKSYRPNFEITYWTISTYTNDWKILEEIVLNADSTVETIEKFTYNNENVKSTIYTNNGKIDTSSSYTYLPNGHVLSYKFTIGNSFNEVKYSYDQINQLKKQEIIEIENNDTVNYIYAKYHTNNQGQIDTITSFDSSHNLIRTNVRTYNGETLDFIDTFEKGELTGHEKYIYEKQWGTKRIITIGYTENRYYLKTIEVK